VDSILCVAVLQPLRHCRLSFQQIFLPALVELRRVLPALVAVVAELPLAEEVVVGLRAAAPVSLQQALARAPAQLLSHHHQALRRRY
jgi:hypothetical protein